MSASAVQFRGCKSVIDAYEMNEVANWALFCGKQILGQYYAGEVDEGAQLLQSWCNKLEEYRSSAIYQLRMYVTAKGPFTNSTDFNYSFQFRLCDSEFESFDGTTKGTSISQIIGELNDIKRKLAEDDQEEEEPEQIGGIGSFFNRMLANPQWQEMMMAKIGALVGSWFNQGPSTVSGMPQEEMMSEPSLDAIYAAMPQEQLEALGRALQILLPRDPEAGTNLLKLAELCRDHPKKYQMAKTFL